VGDKAFVENFVRMEKWSFDSPDMPGETFRQFVKDCYQKNLLIQSKLELGGRRVDLHNITMPLLNIYGRYDHLVPPEAAELLTKRVGTKDVEDLCLDTGHIGIYVSSKCQKEVAPKIACWLQEREQSADRELAPEEVQRDHGAAAQTATKAKPVRVTPGSKRRKRTVAGSEETVHV